MKPPVAVNCIYRTILCSGVCEIVSNVSSEATTWSEAGTVAAAADVGKHVFNRVQTMEPDLIPTSHLSTNLKEQLSSHCLKRLKVTDSLRELQTVLRDKSTNRSDFIFHADRLIRLVVEEGLNQLPYQKCVVTTPTDYKYEGVRYEKGNCGVSIMRSGEAMEQGLRDCCRSIRIGKILIQSEEDTHDARVVYAKLPPDIAKRKILLMYPIMSTGNTVEKAILVLQEHKVVPSNIVLLNLFCTPLAASQLLAKFPDMTILTSEVHPIAPNHFGQKYFGTD